MSQEMSSENITMDNKTNVCYIKNTRHRFVALLWFTQIIKGAEIQFS